jgi:seryl-tRNA synthetase
MLLISNIRQNKDEIISRLAIRGIDAEAIIHEILSLDEQARQARTKMEQNQAQGNQLSAQVGSLFKEGKKEEAESIRVESVRLKEELKALEKEVEEKEEALKNLIITLPNTPNVSVPHGKDADDNFVVLEHGTKVNLPEGALPHWELASKYDIIDFELGVKITGAGFPVYKGKGAIFLERSWCKWIHGNSTAVNGECR